MTDIVERLQANAEDYTGELQCEAAATITTLRADNAALREGLAVSCEKMETSLAAMDKYNEANGTYIIGPSLLSLGKQIATNRALLETSKEPRAMITQEEPANDTVKSELLEAIERAWRRETGGLYTRKLSDGLRYHIMSESCLANEKKVSAKRAEKAVLDRLRNLPDDDRRSLCERFSAHPQAMDSIATALADILEQQP